MGTLIGILENIFPNPREDKMPWNGSKDGSFSVEGLHRFVIYMRHRGQNYIGIPWLIKYGQLMYQPEYVSFYGKFFK